MFVGLNMLSSYPCSALFVIIVYVVSMVLALMIDRKGIPEKQCGGSVEDSDASPKSSCGTNAYTFINLFTFLINEYAQHTHLHIPVYTCTFTNPHTHIHIHVPVYPCTFTNPHTRIHIHTCTRTLSGTVVFRYRFNYQIQFFVSVCNFTFRFIFRFTD